MSRGFVKEDDQEEAPFIPERSPIPPNTPNYVTVRGWRLLLDEKQELLAERDEVEEVNESERRKTLAVLNGRLSLLEERIQSAQIIKTDDQNKEEVRFGAIVTSIVQNGAQKGLERTFQIVGIDEAKVRERRIAFVAPIARALMGLKVGEVSEFKLGDSVQQLRICQIEYE